MMDAGEHHRELLGVSRNDDVSSLRSISYRNSISPNIEFFCSPKSNFKTSNFEDRNSKYRVSVFKNLFIYILVLTIIHHIYNS
ncbi:hypothetical protein YC2023_058268 [Brassica napus]